MMKIDNLKGDLVNTDFRADVFQNTFGAFWFSGVADSSAVRDEPMWKHYPIFFRDEIAQILFDFFGSCFLRNSQSLRKARNVRVHDHAECDAEGVSKHDVGSLSRHAVER